MFARDCSEETAKLCVWVVCCEVASSGPPKIVALFVETIVVFVLILKCSVCMEVKLNLS